jgi:hypothetical protein
MKDFTMEKLDKQSPLYLLGMLIGMGVIGFIFGLGFWFSHQVIIGG